MSSESKRYFVKFDNVSDAALIESVGGKVRHDYANMPELLSAELTEEQVNLLNQNPAIKSINSVSAGRGSSQSMDWGYSKTKVDSYYRQIYTGKNVKIGMVDSGIEVHEDLPYVSGWIDYINDYTYQYDDQGHGTFGAGIISGQDNTVGYIGVAPDVQLYGAKVLDNTNFGWVDDFVAGIDWCISQSVHIINLPLSTADGDYDQDLVDACRRAYNAGIIVVSCSGNGTYSSETKTWSNVGISTVQCPASDYSCVAVGATTTANARASFSDYGDGLDVVAPGEYVVSCDESSYGGYKVASGTSYAAAYVTGHLACLKEKYPSYSRSQLVNKLLNNCLNLGDSYQYGYGLVQAEPLGNFLENEPSVTSRIDAGFNLDWTSIPYTEYYYLYYKKAGDVSWTRKTALTSQYTAENLAYGYAYSFYVEAYRRYLNNGDTYSILIATSNTQIATVNPCPPTLSLVSKTDNSITVQVDLVSGIAEGDVVYISPSGDQSSIETSPGGQVTFTGLTSGIEYTLHAKSWVTGGDGSRVYSLANGPSIYVTPGIARPSDFCWTTPKNQGDPATNLTDDEWNALCAKINDFREYKSYADSSFTAAITGNTFYASQFNQARNAILPMSGAGLPVTKVGVSGVVNPSDADDVRASDLNALVSCLNAIL